MGVRLPSEYQEVEYLDSTSTLLPYIDTGIPITEDLKFEIEFMLINTNIRLYFMGVYRGTDFYLYTGGFGYFQTAFGAPYENTNLAVDTRRHRFVYQINDGILTVKDSDTVILTKQIGTLSANSILIAGTPSGGRTACKTFESKMTKAGVVIQDLIPCYRKSDSEPGMYDLVTKQFFTNAGTGEFLVGPDVLDSISPLMVAWRRIMMAAASVAKKLVKLIATSTTGLVSFDTNVEMPTKVTCEFSPVQEGTGDPSPDNVRPISGWTGCEISHAKAIPVDLEVGGFTSAGLESGDTNRLRSVEFIPVIGGTECSLSFNNKTEDDMSFSCSFYETNEKNKTRISALSWQTENTFMVPNRANYLRVLIRKINGAVMQTTFVDNATIIYNPLVTSITFTDPSTGDPMTIYGGTLTLNEDGSADLVSTHGLAEITSVTPKDSFAANLNGRYRAGYNVSSLGIPSAETRVTAQKLKTNALTAQSSTNIFNYGSAYSVGFNANGGIVFITLSAAENTVALFNEYLDTIGTVQLWYPLATPITYHFDSVGQLNTFLGTNNIWHNMNGDITVEYWNKQ